MTVKKSYDDILFHLMNHPFRVITRKLVVPKLDKCDAFQTSLIIELQSLLAKTISNSCNMKAIKSWIA
jgi:hypothetical protein